MFILIYDRSVCILSGKSIDMAQSNKAQISRPIYSLRVFSTRKSKIRSAPELSKIRPSPEQSKISQFCSLLSALSLKSEYLPSKAKSG
ncbi:unnamed protein product [Brassica rapa]|uniref:Uncharacterized protein n=1 Tax=Brassica campestris TaxID=3711 RepID=A0A8D9H653_BRACM|nr:unnamed protein product [Brassica rapa]CAG7893759.1 unnamed protein product [Brassica rapa]